MMWQMQSKFPRHRYHPVPGITCACNKCPHMARNTLEKLRDCLRDGKPEITWQPEFDKAKEVLERSLLQPAKRRKAIDCGLCLCDGLRIMTRKPVGAHHRRRRRNRPRLITRLAADDQYRDHHARSEPARP